MIKRREKTKLMIEKEDGRRVRECEGRDGGRDGEDARRLLSVSPTDGLEIRQGRDHVGWLRHGPVPPRPGWGTAGAGTSGISQRAQQRTDITLLWIA